jgi:hypothetical protein
MSSERMIFQNGCRTAAIEPRTFGGFRITQNDWYFELVQEEFADTYEQAKEYAEAWINNEIIKQRKD